MLVGRLSFAVSVALAATGLAFAASAAKAANRVYWANFAGNTIPFADLDGSGAGGNVNSGGAMVNEPAGVAIDPATNTVYWANFGASSISFAKLDGTGGGGTLNTAPITPNEPAGLALDAATGKIYWADFGDNKIEFANLDGSGGGVVNTMGAPVAVPEGVAVDDATGRIYWANCGGPSGGPCNGTGTGANTIGFANLNQSGGGPLATTGVTPDRPIGVAADSATGQLFWADFGDNKIEFANLNGTGGGGVLSTAPVTPNGPQGVAVDPSAGKVYWADFARGTIGVANVNNSGGNLVNTSGETLTFPVFPAVLETPVGAGSPVVGGAAAAPTTLTCPQGRWAGDHPEALLYDAPQSFSFSWTNNGVPIAGATASTLAVSGGGSYACLVTAHNQAGATTQASPAFTVAPTVQLGAVATSGKTATLTIVCEGAVGQTCTGGVVGTSMERERGSTIVAVSASAKNRHKHHPPKVMNVAVTVATASYSVPGGQAASVPVTLNGAGARLLAEFYRLPVQLVFSGSTTGTEPVTYSFPRLHPTVDDFWTWTNTPCSPCFTTVDKLTLTGLNPSENVIVRCAGSGCPFGTRVSKKHGHQLALGPSFGGVHLAPGASLQIEVTAPGNVGFVRTFRIVAGSSPGSADRCLPPGARHPTACA
jgi:DNA-binding beta-propeller fold protein YncE